MTEQADYISLNIDIQADSSLGSCPFCGSPVERITLYGDTMACYPALFECKNQECGARVLFPITKNWTKEKEKDLWNRRAEK